MSPHNKGLVGSDGNSLGKGSRMSRREEIQAEITMLQNSINELNSRIYSPQDAEVIIAYKDTILVRAKELERLDAMDDIHTATGSNEYLDAAHKKIEELEKNYQHTCKKLLESQTDHQHAAQDLIASKREVSRLNEVIEELRFSLMVKEIDRAKLIGRLEVLETKDRPESTMITMRLEEFREEIRNSGGGTYAVTNSAGYPDWWNIGKKNTDKRGY